MSFERMAGSFPQQSEFALGSFAWPHFCDGILPRIMGVVEARHHFGDINQRCILFAVLWGVYN